ncbi:MAG: amidohydrolase family protein [Candidatus Sulfotelmatobacter sp.]
MNRRSFLKSANAAGLALALPASTFAAQEKDRHEKEKKTTPTTAAPSPNTILLKDYRPVSIHKVPVTHVDKAKFPIIDMHSHPYPKTDTEITTWLKNMDEVNVEKTMILTMTTGKAFDDFYAKYSKYPDRFEVWCGLDFTGYKTAAFPDSAVKELERGKEKGAKGIGEIHDKGQGLRSGKSSAPGLHPDDPRVDAIWEKAAELHMPISLHVADPIWMYQPMDKHNDGLMNAFEWRLDNQPNIVKLTGMVDILERTAARHRNTTFVACHFANLDYDLTHLGEAFDRNPNLYADISARYAETAPIPRFAAQFYAKYADRLVYGTDMGFDQQMYRTTFRILESQDEHFYEIDQFGYHWPLNGLGLNDEILQRVYHQNAAKLLQARDA